MCGKRLLFCIFYVWYNFWPNWVKLYWRINTCIDGATVWALGMILGTILGPLPVLEAGFSIASPMQREVSRNLTPVEFWELLMEAQMFHQDGVWQQGLGAFRRTIGLFWACRGNNRLCPHFLISKDFIGLIALNSTQGPGSDLLVRGFLHLLITCAPKSHFWCEEWANFLNNFFVQGTEFCF